VKHIKTYYKGNCVNSFDEDGYCTVPDLYSDTSDFAYNEENAKVVTKEEFEKTVTVPKDLDKEIGTNRTYLHDANNNIYMLYDEDEDIHYFFK
jgi:hypothetical protein